MMVLVSGATKTLPKMDPELTGILVTPRRGYSEEFLSRWRWAADNEAYSQWDADAFMRMLWRLRGVSGCLFVSAPDVVANAKKTRRLWDIWRPALEGFPRAYVIQNGEDGSTVPWDDCQAVFVGGDTDWKLGPEARALVAKAKTLGKWVHMGRVNTGPRWRYALDLGCDSIDGSGFSRWPDEMLRRLTLWRDDRKRQPTLELDTP